MKLFIQDPNVRYHGKVLPRDGQPIKVPITDPNVSYNGSILPRDQVAVVPFKDTANTPGFINIGGIILPPDTMITPIEGDKEMVMTTILDGPSCFERITTKATKIEFDMILRMQTQGGQTFYNTNTSPPGLSGPINNVFAQQYLHDVWFNVFRPNTVQPVQNSVLNNLNITQLIIEKCHIRLVRGSTNIPCTIIAWENEPGQSLIINP